MTTKDSIPVVQIAIERAPSPRDHRPIAVEWTFTAPPLDAATVAERQRGKPLSIGLALDRSGSMNGAKLEAAKAAAQQLVDGLPDGSRFAGAAFDDEVVDIGPSVRLDTASRADLASRLATVRAGGSTALYDGFTRAATLVAEGAPAESTRSWVVVLSDGMGNCGPTAPEVLSAHARRLAAAGICTIAIGIGADYLATQLGALAEGGQGALHHASLPEEISEIVLGELGGLQSLAVTDLAVSGSVAGARVVRYLGGAALSETDTTNGIAARFHRVLAGRTVRAYTLLRPVAPDSRIAFAARWRDEAGRPQEHATTAELAGGPADRDVDLAQRVADSWAAWITCEAMRLNDLGQYREAQALVEREKEELLSYVAGLPCERELRLTLRRLASLVSRQWMTMGKKEIFNRADKMRCWTPEYRGGREASISELLDRESQ